MPDAAKETANEAVIAPDMVWLFPISLTTATIKSRNKLYRVKMPEPVHKSHNLFVSVGLNLGTEWEVAIVMTQFKRKKCSLKSSAIVPSSLPCRQKRQNEKFTLKPFSEKASRRAERQTKSSVSSGNFMFTSPGKDNFFVLLESDQISEAIRLLFKKLWKLNCIEWIS